MTRYLEFYDRPKQKYLQLFHSKKKWDENCNCCKRASNYRHQGVRKFISNMLDAVTSITGEARVHLFKNHYGIIYDHPQGNSNACECQYIECIVYEKKNTQAHQQRKKNTPHDDKGCTKPPNKDYQNKKDEKQTEG